MRESFNGVAIIVSAGMGWMSVPKNESFRFHSNALRLSG